MFTTLFLLSALFCTGSSLTCYRCVPETSLRCTDTRVECAEGRCGYLQTTAYVGRIIRVDMVMKNCLSPQLCLAASVNFGVTKTIISNQCCSSDLCNFYRTPAVMRNKANGRRCYTCSGGDCAALLDCVDEEDRCIQSTVGADGQVVKMKGCATRSFCTGALSTPSNWSSAEGAVPFSCCEGNLCNSAEVVTQRLLLALLLLIFIQL